MTFKKFVTVCAANAMCLASAASGDFRMPAIFAAHMVLQQGCPVRLWGWATEGEKVTVTFRDQTVTAVTTNGRWQVTLKPMSAGGPYPLKIAGNNVAHIEAFLEDDEDE